MILGGHQCTEAGDVSSETPCILSYNNCLYYKSCIGSTTGNKIIKKTEISFYRLYIILSALTNARWFSIQIFILERLPSTASLIKEIAGDRERQSQAVVDPLHPVNKVTMLNELPYMWRSS